MTTTAFKFDPHQPRDSDGRWTDGPGGGLPAVKTFSSSAAGRQVWLTSDDPGKRGASIFAETYEGNRAIRRAATNLREGREPLDGVDVSPMHRVWDKKRPGGGYQREDLEADIVRGAQWLNDQLDSAPPSGTLVRGMRIEPGKLPKPGDSFDGQPVSWSDQSTAFAHAYNPNDPFSPVDDRSRNGWHPVFVVSDGLNAADVGSQVMGRLAGQQPEWVSHQPLRVVSVETYDPDNPQLPERLGSYGRDNMPIVIRVEAA